MECFICSRTCPTSAIRIDKIDSCIRLLEKRAPIKIIEEKCTECGQCDEICPMGDVALSAESCSFCIVCNNRPNCILPNSNRVSFLNSISSIVRLMMHRFIYRNTLYNNNNN